MKASIKDKVELFHEENPNVRFISGKWFTKQSEIKDINKYFARIGTFESPKQVKDAVEMFVLLYGEDGEWLEMPIVTDAKKQEKLYPLAFPLTKEQLMIIRIMIEGKEEAMFICTGIGGSGKSTFLNIIRQIYSEDCSAVTLDCLSGFNLAEAVKHRLIASDELASGDLDNGALKTIISKQPIQVNGKFQIPCQIKAQSALFFCCNNPPRVDIDDSGLLRRIYYYSRNEKIKNPDLSLKSKHYTPMELQNIVAHALRTDITNWRKTFENDTREYLSKWNSVRISGADDYATYISDCKGKGLKAYSEPRWQNILKLFKEWGVVGKKGSDSEWVKIPEKELDILDLI